MEQDTWTVLDSYFRDNENFLTKHHLHSFDDFIQNKIPATIKSLNPFIMLKNDQASKLPKHEVRIFIGGEKGDKIYFIQPQQADKPLLPNLARLRSLTYKADILCDVTITYITYEKDGETIEKEKTVDMEKVKLGSIPIMLKSCLCYLYKQPQIVLKEFGECPYDQGGYMIVDGKEKVIVAQERIATNRLFINKSVDPEYSFKGLLRCTIENAAVFPKTIKIGVYKTPSRKNSIVFSLPNINHEICLFTLFRALGVENDHSILSYIVGDVDDPENAHLLNFLYYSMRDGAFVYSQQHALEYLASFVKYAGEVDYVQYVLLNDFFPNLNEGRLFDKPLLLGHITKHIIQVCLGLEKESDRDSYGFKRVDISGFLLSNLFRDFYNKFRNTCRSEIDRLYNYGPYKNDDENFDQLINPLNMWQVFDPNIIGNGIERSLKASWGVEKDASKQGAVQDLNRISFIGYASHMRRVNTPIDRSIKIVAPHRLHATQWGMMCPCETPDGASIGLLKNLAILCHITFDCKSSSIITCLKEQGVSPLAFIDPSKLTKDICKVMINSTWYGVTNDPMVLTYKLRLLRRNSLINVMTSIAWNVKDGEIHINTEAGRCCRPIFIVKNNELLIKPEHIENLKSNKLTWHDLIRGKTRDSFSLNDSTYYSPKDIFKIKSDKTPYTDKEIWKQLEKNQSVIEFIDVEETENSLIAMHFTDLQDVSKKYTHAEIHPSTIFAVLTANIPFANHNQAPRNYFSGAQGKQAIGVYSTAFNNRMDTAGLVLYYPQRRVVNTRYMHYIGNNDMPNGENTIVAIMTYTGFNQEDSVIINKSAIERGLFNLTYYKTITTTEDSDKNGHDRVIFINPQKQHEQGTEVEGFGKRFANYKKLDENGLPITNVKIEEGDVYLGKCLVQVQTTGDNEKENDIFKSKRHKETWKDKSLIADKTMSGIIDKVYVYENSKGHKGCKIRMRKVRIPVLGDKMGCYSDDTDILTFDGWKPFKHLEPTDKVATMVGNRLVYQVPTEIQKYKFKGKMYKLSSNQIELLVTDNHRMYVRTDRLPYKVVQAKDVFRKVRFYKKNVDEWKPDLSNLPKEFVIKDGKLVGFKLFGCVKNKQKYEDVVLDIKPWLVFLGIWYAEGHADEISGVRFAANKPRVKKELDKVCKSLNFMISKVKTSKEDKEHNSWRVYDKLLTKYVKDYSVGSTNKILPDWVWYLERDLCKELIKGMLLGDGDFGTVAAGRYYTASTKLADDFQRLCLHAGYASNKCLKSEAGLQATKKDGSIIRSFTDYYCLSVITKQTEPKVNKYMHSPHFTFNDSWVDYDGYVFCCTVPEGEGLLYVRRHGFGVWSGNSQHAQKGCTGMIIPYEDMPYTKDGIVPDIIINPHAIPTRMTIGHLLECIFAKTGCLEGDYLDSTPFCYQNIDKVYDRLEKMKYERYGNEIMYNGINGGQINTEIFIGPTYYIRMKHMVQDKINYRSNEGGYVSLTRQPVKSRAKGGGLRIGEMETNTILSHGMSAFLRESLMDRADKYETFVEQTSGNIITTNNKSNYAETADEVSRIQIPYAAKTLYQELEAMSICPRFITDVEEFYEQSPNELEIEWDADYESIDTLNQNIDYIDDE